MTLIFLNLINSSLVAKGMTDEVWLQSDFNWRQEVVHKHIYIYQRGRHMLGVKSVHVLILCTQSYHVSRLARNVTTIQLLADFLY